MMLSQTIDRIRAQLWIEDLREGTGIESIFALGAKLDQKSIWIDPSGIPHQSKWYRFAKGDQIPSVTLVSKVKALVPNTTFNVHHPVWSVLRRPEASPRTWRRHRAQMPPAWRSGLKLLGAMPLTELRVNLNFVRRLGLEDFSYLDALFLIESARCQAIVHKQIDRTVAIIALLYALPLLYVDDPIWWRDDLDRISQMLTFFDQALRLGTQQGLDVNFPVEERVIALSLQQRLILRHLAKHPTALGTSALRRRYFARQLYDEASIPFRIATTAFHSPSPTPTLNLVTGAFPVDERLWRWAWHELEYGDASLRTVNLREVEQIWGSRTASKEN